MQGSRSVTPPKASDSFETVNIFPDFWANSSSRDPKQTSMPTPSLKFSDDIQREPRQASMVEKSRPYGGARIMLAQAL